MEQTVRVVRRLEGGRAQVIHVRESACSGDCHKCSGCGAAKETMLLEVDNPIGADVGDLVILSSDTKNILTAAAVVYVLPLVLFFLGYALASGWGGGIGFALGVAIIVWFDRYSAGKNETVHTITGYARKYP